MVLDAVTAWAPDAGAVGIVIFAVLAVLRGWLVPARTVDLMRADYASRVEDLRAANSALAAANEKLAGQVDVLVEVGSTTNALLSSIRTVQERAS